MSDKTLKHHLSIPVCLVIDLYFTQQKLHESLESVFNTALHHVAAARVNVSGNHRL